ncbi:2-succinyl-6-hydroxy-2,4-cyclohexadiene-1-carboxylate synthase [Anabaena sp. FACHB-1237]|uniref:2-succinyl-6-hydroxy-2, 4-cyclohexadiene-1-carboxylate synthase n=1 Tax=Anabaena sp. FACHB-1237 TaxID=2692769 RepID=UPI0016810846|nr:2-succinyl-6-hydroxy-2,4-cyclohexadiene-1-carboxylate synthase [Anabaena sp. FACHB-1237]MBD2138671.1 2-succinyl-6-hydroxy-2,4-cyclohexadiene-1-carboxylate synthase [Anabaena sp. FACHB-1237]
MQNQNYLWNYCLIEHSQKPVILFLHGFMGNIHEFSSVINLLNDDFSYLCVDLPGHGKTQVLHDECYTMENTAIALIHLLDNLQIHQCFLIGYSLGGRLALYLTLHFPDRFIKVILESASPGLLTQIARLSRIKHDQQIARKLTRIANTSEFYKFLDFWYQQPIFGNIKHQQFYENMLNSRLQNNPLTLVKSLQFMGTGVQPCLWDKLFDNIISILLIVGEKDDKFVNLNQEMLQSSPLLKLQIVANVGHNIHLENTSIFVQNIRHFFVELKGCLKSF